MNFPKYIIVHHTAVSRKQNSRQFKAVKQYHIGKGWGDIGYHWFIEPNGRIIKGRDENQAGAHCYQNFMNYRSIGICLTGNFDIEEPTKGQLKSLERLIKIIQKKYSIPNDNVVGHRKFAPKTCPGNNLTDKMMQNSLSKVSPWALKSVEKATKKGIDNWENPQELIANSTAEWIFKDLGIIDKVSGEGLTKERFIVALDRAGLL